MVGKQCTVDNVKLIILGVQCTVDSVKCIV